MREKSESVFSSVIPSDHFGILHTEMRTGILTDQYGRRALRNPDDSAIGSNVNYLIFASLDVARSYAKQKILENPEIECVILNDKREQVDLIRNTEYIIRVTDEEIRRNEARRGKRPWWKLW